MKTFKKQHWFCENQDSSQPGRVKFNELLKSHVVENQKLVTESELNFLERYDVGYVIRLFEMSKTGLPICPIRTADLRATLKTTLKKFKTQFDEISGPLKAWIQNRKYFLGPEVFLYQTGSSFFGPEVIFKYGIPLKVAKKA